MSQARNQMKMNRKLIESDFLLPNRNPYRIGLGLHSLPSVTHSYKPSGSTFAVLVQILSCQEFLFIHHVTTYCHIYCL